MEAVTRPAESGSARPDMSVTTPGDIVRASHNSAANSECGVNDGSLPGSCATLAYPYIPMQGNNPPRYSQNDAMQAGTLFPGLNLPFHKEIRSRFPMANSALSELMALDFAIQELGLYLNTHANDKEVLELYWSYVRLGKQGREKYVAQYGPLCETDITPGSFKWLNDPWPWDREGNN